MGNAKKLLIIGSVWPEPDSSAAGRRMMQLIELFQSAGWRVTFASSSVQSNHAVDLSAHDIETVSININDSAVDTFLADLKPDAVMFDRFVIEEQFGWRVAEQCPKALRILDTEDLHSLRRARKKTTEENRAFNRRDLLKGDTAKREIASIYRSDCSLIISEYEMDLLINLFDVDPSLLQYVPFLLESMEESELRSTPAFEGRAHFVTIGNFRHAPNMDAVQFLSQSIWPLIRKELPRAQMHVYGAYPSKKAVALHQPSQGFHIKGRVQSSVKVMQDARVCLAPLRFGAGLKGKLVEAMQCGTPSVTTSIGAEGLAGAMEWPGMIANQPDELAAAAVSLYKNREKWEKAQQQGWKVINQRFDKKQHGKKLLNRIDTLQNKLKEHRRENFIGQMLMHHTTASTTYMAKWIEEKNRD